MEFEVRGNRQAAIRFRVMADKALDAKPVMAVIRELIIRGHREQFDTHGGFLGDEWPPLADATIARKQREGLPEEPLVATGALGTALAGGAGKSTTVTRAMVRVGLNKRTLWYAIFAASGASEQGRRGSEPPRPITGMNVDEGEEAISMIQKFVTGEASL